MDLDWMDWVGVGEGTFPKSDSSPKTKTSNQNGLCGAHQIGHS